MAIFGWLCLVVIMCYVSLSYLLIAMNNLGHFNIGGRLNSTSKKVLTLLCGVGIGWLWVTVFNYAPFTVTVHS